MPAKPNLTAYIAAANEVDIANKRVVDATAALAAAKTDRNAASYALKMAKGDPTALLKADADSAAALTHAELVLKVSETGLANARQVAAQAWGEAHRPIHDEGRAIRLAAIRRADAARKELIAADADFAAGNALVREARHKGCAATGHLDGGMLVRPLAAWTEADEQKLWS